MKILVTGFEPFGGEAVNPAWEAVKRLEGEIGPYRVHAIEIPTVFGAAARAVLEYGLRLVISIRALLAESDQSPR